MLASFRQRPIWALIVLAVVMRWGSFYPSVINHDESTYIVIADELLRGQTYWVDVIDTKPVGIFLVYGLMILLTGGSIVGMRLLTAVLIGWTAGMLFRLNRHATGSERVGWAAGIGYVILTSVFAFYGLSPNTELFFNLFTVGALTIVWPPGRQWWHYILAGLLLGIGFLIKSVVAADAFALGVLLLWWGAKYREWWRTIFQRALPLTLAFFVPFLLVYAYYFRIGQGDQFLFFTFELPARYALEVPWWEPLRFMGDFAGRFFPFTLLAIFAWRERQSADHFWQAFCLWWFACVTLIILLPGKSFGHYQIQLMPAFASLAAVWWLPARSGQASLRRFFSRTRQWLLPGFLLLVSSAIWLDHTILKRDTPRILARSIRPHLEGGDRVYTGNTKQILYHLLHSPATRYVHPSLLFDPNNAEALQIDLEAAAQEIIDQDRPIIALTWEKEQFPDHPVILGIHRAYQPIDTVEKIVIWQRKEKLRDAN
jgi:4-amino-4-deoxy-L-arabinose transferase-like glycosyltransferase